jgi:hypothetical protein
VFCSRSCRHRGERAPHERHADDPAAVARLFDESRNPQERVRPDDWHPGPGTPFFELDAHDTAGKRRAWYRNLHEAGRR